MVFTLALHCFGSVVPRVIRSGNELDESEEFSPYYEALLRSDQQKSKIKEYERLKQQLIKFHAIDWNVIAEVKAFESNSSS